MSAVSINQKTSEVINQPVNAEVKPQDAVEMASKKTESVAKEALQPAASAATQAALQPASNTALQPTSVLSLDKDAEAKHIAALQLGCYAQSQLAQHSVNGVLAKVTRQQWVCGVYVLFEAAVSRVFFETFATTLHGKGGWTPLNVLVNASQRMLAVQAVLAQRGIVKSVSGYDNVPSAEEISKNRESILKEIDTMVSRVSATLPSSSSKEKAPVAGDFSSRVKGLIDSINKFSDDWIKAGAEEAKKESSVDSIVTFYTETCRRLNDFALNMVQQGNNSYAYLIDRTYVAGDLVNQVEKNKMKEALNKASEAQKAGSGQEDLSFAEGLLDKLNGKGKTPSSSVPVSEENASLIKKSVDSENERKIAKEESSIWTELVRAVIRTRLNFLSAAKGILEKRPISDQLRIVNNAHFEAVQYQKDLEATLDQYSTKEKGLYELLTCPDRNKEGGHILVKVATDGRFVITTTPTQSPPTEIQSLDNLQGKIAPHLENARTWHGKLRSALDAAQKEATLKKDEAPADITSSKEEIGKEISRYEPILKTFEEISQKLLSRKAEIQKQEAEKKLVEQKPGTPAQPAPVNSNPHVSILLQTLGIQALKALDNAITESSVSTAFKLAWVEKENKAAAAAKEKADKEAAAAKEKADKEAAAAKAEADKKAAIAQEVAAKAVTSASRKITIDLPADLDPELSEKLAAQISQYAKQCIRETLEKVSSMQLKKVEPVGRVSLNVL